MGDLKSSEQFITPYVPIHWGPLENCGPLRTGRICRNVGSSFSGALEYLGTSLQSTGATEWVHHGSRTPCDPLKTE